MAIHWGDKREPPLDEFLNKVIGGGFELEDIRALWRVVANVELDREQAHPTPRRAALFCEASVQLLSAVVNDKNGGFVRRNQIADHAGRLGFRSVGHVRVD